jgi:hypothetical protein
MCPPNFKVEIEGHSPMEIMIPGINLVGGIAHVFVCKTGRAIIDSVEFSKKIKLLAFDKSQRYAKVRNSLVVVFHQPRFRQSLVPVWTGFLFTKNQSLCY